VPAETENNSAGCFIHGDIGAHMCCTECQSNNPRELKTEMMIHHANSPNGRADVFIFPKAWVCLNCGFSTFVIPPIELQVLRDGEIETGAKASSTDGLG
jgi:hypothetical protein